MADKHFGSCFEEYHIKRINRQAASYFLASAVSVQLKLWQYNIHTKPYLSSQQFIHANKSISS